MFNMSKPENQKALDHLIDDVTEHMDACGPGTEEYEQLLKQLERLMKLKQQDKPKPISRDTMLLVGGNILGILIVVAYEHTHVVTSKAFGNILKPKTNET